MWYFETAHPLGHWSPQCSLTEPRVRSKQGQPDRIGSDTGPRIRGLVQIQPGHHGLPLDHLRAIYGPKDATATPADPQRPGFRAEDSGNR